MSYFVFSQSPDARVDPAALLTMARRHFAIEIDVLAEEALSAGRRVDLAVSGGDPRRTVRVAVTARVRTAADLRAANAAELRGRAGGMAALSERCPTIWEVHAEALDDPLVLELCGVLASIALGPVLPPDGSTLFGVRGARERAALKR